MFFTLFQKVAVFDSGNFIGVNYPELDVEIFTQIIADLPQGTNYLVDESSSSVRPSEIEVKQGCVGYSKIGEKSPEVADISSAQGHKRDEGWVEVNAHGFGNPGDNKPLRVALTEHDEAGEVQLRGSADCEPYILACVFS